MKQKFNCIAKDTVKGMKHYSLRKMYSNCKLIKKNMKLILTKKNLFDGEFLHLAVGDRSMIIKSIECGVQLNSQVKTKW